MTLRDLLTKISEEKPHSFTDAKLISFVNEIEADVAEQYYIKEVPVYADNHTDLDRRLLAPSPYDRLYVSYVKAMIDYSNEEYDSYANNQAQHVQDFREFADWVVRTGQAESDAIPHRFIHAMY